MNYLNVELPWIRIYEFLLEIGRVHVPRDFCLNLMESANQLVPYDQARVYFINDNRKVYDIALYGAADRSWIEAYFEYYSKIEGERYSLTPKVKPSIIYPVSCVEWSNLENDEFITDYIKPQGFRHSLTILFHNESGLTNTVLTFERTSNKNYTQKEILITEIIQAHLDNLYKNLHVLPVRDLRNLGTHESIQQLTQRELEVVQLICDGVKPVHISEKLYLSLGTVYKHLANIYAKLHVTNLQELILLATSNKIKISK